jgi:serine/threonine protein kinase
MDSPFLEKRFLGQGTYGCIYKEKLQCTDKKNKKKGPKHSLSKVYIDEKYATRELEISKHIIKIPHYDRYFSPLLNSCNASLAQLNQEDVDKCDLFDKNPSVSTEGTPPTEQTYFTTTTKYIPGQILNEYIDIYSKQNTTTSKDNKIFYIYTCLTKSIDLLNSKKIVHFDLSERNIIMDSTDRPIIIDYGMSMNIDAVKTEDQFKYEFGHYSFTKEDDPNKVDMYDPWCVEIMALMYLNQRVQPQEIITETHVAELIKYTNQYVDNLELDKLGATEDEIKTYRESKCSLYETQVNKSAHECSQELLKTYPKWDPYAIALICLKQLTNRERTKPIINQMLSKILA